MNREIALLIAGLLIFSAGIIAGVQLALLAHL
jgi:hypothetical protein